MSIQRTISPQNVHVVFLLLNDQMSATATYKPLVLTIYTTSRMMITIATTAITARAIVADL